MATTRVASLLSLLAMAVTHPAQQQYAAANQLPFAADQLWTLLGETVEGAVARALAGQQQCGADAGQQALTELGRLQQRLEDFAHDVAAVKEADSAAPSGTRQPSQQLSETEPELEQQPAGEAEEATVCERQPAPLPVLAVSRAEPRRRACARSCLQLRDQGGSPQDGVYWLTGLPVPVLCDFSHDGGGWTLLLTATSRDGWDLLSVKTRRGHSPTLTDNYSILRHADVIRDLGTGGRFAYRIEAQAETGRRRWGGVWLAPRSYSFVDETGSQTGVRLVRRFDRWAYKDQGIERRMPWLRVEGGDTTVLTTSDVRGDHWWGTLVTHQLETSSNFRHSPWINGEAVISGTVLYWMREEEL